ncbi:unnamed protein product [Bathycoccus prasinos]
MFVIGYPSFWFFSMKQFPPDFGLWLLNICSTIGVVLINKQLMSVDGYAYNYPTTLSGLHFFSGWMALFILTFGPGLDQLVSKENYACLGTYSAVSFQIIGHLKTILIYVLGVSGFGLAVCGVVCYNISSCARKESSATSTEATQELPVQSTFQQRALGLGFAFAFILIISPGFVGVVKWSKDKSQNVSLDNSSYIMEVGVSESTKKLQFLNERLPRVTNPLGDFDPHEIDCGARVAEVRKKYGSQMSSVGILFTASKTEREAFAQRGGQPSFFLKRCLGIFSVTISCSEICNSRKKMKLPRLNNLFTVHTQGLKDTLNSMQLGNGYAKMMTNTDIGLVWNQCGENMKCKLLKPPQRLINHWSTGLPTIVYRGYASILYLY